jgi:hypothetical protein
MLPVEAAVATLVWDDADLAAKRAKMLVFILSKKKLHCGTRRPDWRGQGKCRNFFFAV